MTNTEKIKRNYKTSTLQRLQEIIIGSDTSIDTSPIIDKYFEMESIINKGKECDILLEYVSLLINIDLKRSFLGYTIDQVCDVIMDALETENETIINFVWESIINGSKSYYSTLDFDAKIDMLKLKRKELLKLVY